MQKFKIGYFGDGPWAHKTFEKLIMDDRIDITFVCVRYDKPDYILESMASNAGIKTLCHKNINSDDFKKIISPYDSDLFVSMSFNQIFKKELIRMPPMKTINCHAGKLPFYRGRNILNWVLINDEKEFGITVHYMDEGIDTGDIILQRLYPITDKDNYQTLLETAHKECADILYDAIKLMQQGNIRTIRQDSIDPVGFYCGIRTEGDEILKWNQDSRSVFNFVRAVCRPGPQALSYIDGSAIRINKVEMVPGARHYKNTVGQVVGKSKDGFYVKTKDTIVKVVEYSYDKNIRIGDRLKER